jgi:indolepyruvate ferredoxin oxidoreductase alpha subunit
VGKELFGNIGEYTPDRLAAAIFGEEKGEGFGKGISILPRPPLFCIGCGHRSAFHVLRDLDAMVAGDIGCYTMGALPPFEASHTTLCMGASIGNAFGFERAGVKRVVAVIGDSTFIHGGIPALIDAVYNKGRITVVILDNGTTGMTGGQVHPGVDRTLKGEPTKKLDLEALVRAVGVEFVRSVDAWELVELKRAIREAMEFEGPAVVVVRGACQRLPEMRRRSLEPFRIDREVCYRCDLCLALRCPALTRDSSGRPEIAAEECVACGVCAQVCPVEAIEQ